MTRRPEGEGDGDTLNADRHVAQNVETIATLGVGIQAGADLHQRGMDRLTETIGRPGTVYVAFLVIVTWISWNGAAAIEHQPSFDPPPFFWLQGMIGTFALLMTTIVLTTQIRLGKIAERRAHLDLQINLLSEQKAAKIIELLEELRRDMPNVRDRVDRVADVMQEAADPGVVFSALQKIEKPEDEKIEG